jgi:hypothetical protein
VAGAATWAEAVWTTTVTVLERKVDTLATVPDISAKTSPAAITIAERLFISFSSSVDSRVYFRFL